VRSTLAAILVACSGCSSKEAPAPNLSQISDSLSSQSAVLAPGDTYSVFQSRTVTPGPTGRFQTSLVFDAASGRSILFGGNRRGQYVAETWTYDRTWSTCSSSTCAAGPGARGQAGFAYAPGLGTAILFGGFSDVGVL
jgi:hypothetical protein